MKRLSLGLVAALLNAPRLAHGSKVTVFAVGDNVTIQGKTIIWSSGGVRETRSCDPPRVLSLSADNKFFGCCEEGNTLRPAGKEFHCCAAGHDVAGDDAVGYSCCPEGDGFDGRVCKRVCANGRVLVDGKCACPRGLVEAADGSCREKAAKEASCSSGLKTGKCYMFRGESGRRLAYKGKGYSEAQPHKDAIPGKFQLCRDERCTPGLAIDPSDEVHIRDLHGSSLDNADAGQWMDGTAGGAHIGRTPAYAKSGNFTLTRWPCGKYCLSGLFHGLGPACPADEPSITFYRSVSEACVEFELLEVPCSIRDDANNCIWRTAGGQCCGKMDCSAPAPGPGPDPESPPPSGSGSGSGSGSPPPQSSDVAPPPGASKPPKTPRLCPDLHGTTLTAGGIGFSILCGWHYEPSERIEKQKDIPDPLSCHAKCVADKKCQGANWDFSKFFCTHCFDWEAVMRAGNDSFVAFRPSLPRPF